MRNCLICGRESSKPVLAFLDHLMLVDFSMLQYFKGNRKIFGLWGAIKSMSPLLQIPFSIKYRGSRIVIPNDFDGEA